jgi:uncharacterized OsmC-like protein
MKPETIRETIHSWEQQPEKAKTQPTVKVRSDGAQAVIEAGPFTWRTDLPAPLGGTNQAPSPTAHLLGALGGCAVVFIRDTLAPQLGVRLDVVEATVQCQSDARGLLAMVGIAPDLQDIQLSIQVQSPDGEAAAQKLYQAWLQRCPVYLAITKPMKVAASMHLKAS